MIRELRITCPDGSVIVLDLDTGERTELPGTSELFWAEVGHALGNAITSGTQSHDAQDCDCDDCRKGRGR